MSPRDRRLAETIPAERSILVDTSVVLAYLGGGEETTDLAREIFDSFAATGRNPTALSAITVAEILVRPFRLGPARTGMAEGFLRYFGNLRVVDVTYDIAREAARICAESDLAMPEALIAASAAAVGNVDVLVTNDRSWPARLAPVMPEIKIVVLSELV
jgi:predicted nucleic acid-binding protein